MSLQITDKTRWGFPSDCKINVSKKDINGFLYRDINVEFIKHCKFSEGEINIGVMVSGNVKESGVIVTHEETVNQYKLPFAFPAVVSKISGSEKADIMIVCDYYKTHSAFRNVKRKQENDSFFCGIFNEKFSVNAGDIIKISIYIKVDTKDFKMITERIGECADIVLGQFGCGVNTFENDYSYNVKSFEQACRGLRNNLLDRRAIIQDGIGTFNPYGYHEVGAYTESFACMDVAKGLYRYAIISKEEKTRQFILNELLKMVDQNAEYKWIDTVHNTEGFFHLAWGAIPQDSGVKSDYKREKGLFSDFCGHEEGPNLLSTFKYYDRVAQLGEAALIEGNKEIKEGFLKTMPFVNSLKNEDYSQPVTYDLDSHKPVTGNNDGGSAGGAAEWVMIHFTAYRLTNDNFYKTEALKGLAACNKLDYTHMFSMRCAPKPIALGWVIRANCTAFMLTEDISYINHALKIAKGMFAHYYICPHPYTFFSTLGFGYACGRERWEAFREMVEALWLAAPVLKYAEDKNLFKLYSLARQNILWALPINGNPYGNLTRDYDSIGGEYIPFEFSTGHIGDNPCLDGGCQSSMRQIKEIYGSGEVFLAYLLFEAYATSSDKDCFIINTDSPYELFPEEYNFMLYNNSDKDKDAVIRFKNMFKGSFKLEYNGIEVVLGETRLSNGYKINIKGESILSLKLVKSGKAAAKVNTEKGGKKDFNISGYENIRMSCNEEGYSHYIVNVKNSLVSNEYTFVEPVFDIIIDREIINNVEVNAVKQNGDIVTFDAVEFMPIFKDMSFNENFVSKHNIKTENFEVITDGHMAMFYGVNPDLKSGKAIFDLGIKEEGFDLLQFNLTSLNNCCKWSAVIYSNNKKTELIKDSTKTGLYELPLNIEKGSYMTLEFSINTTAGLGFSVADLGIFKAVKSEETLLPFSYKYENGITTAVCELKPAYPFVEIAIEEMGLNENIVFYLKGKELKTEVEEKFPVKYFRGSAGIYKFKLPVNEKKMTLTVTLNSKRKFINAVKMTVSGGYQIYTKFF